MRSKFVDHFNHDDSADGYDADVRDESNPVRAGYAKALAWVVEQSHILPGDRVLELGSGSGNLTRLLPECRELVCVDISNRMEILAQAKLGSRPTRSFIQDDILGFWDRDCGDFDVILSTYTLHHLTAEEKQQLFHQLRKHLLPGGRFVVADLMIASAGQRKALVDSLRQKNEPEAADSLLEEFYWEIDNCSDQLRQLGFIVHTFAFSELSHGLIAEIPHR